MGGIGPRALKLSAQYADLWNTGYMGQPETFAGPLAKIAAACREVGRDPATLGITALIGLWFPDLQAQRPRIFDHTLTGTAPELAAAMRGYAELGVQHIMFQCEPYTPEARARLTEALQLYRSMDRSMGSTDSRSAETTERFARSASSRVRGWFHRPTTRRGD